MALNGLKANLFRRYLTWLTRPVRIKKHLSSTLPVKKDPAPVDRRRIRAAALQLEFRLFKNPLDYAEEMCRQTAKAAAEGAQLAVFPEYNNLQLLGMLPGIEKVEEGSEEDVSLPDLFRYLSPVVEPLVHTLFANLASAYGLYIMAGSYTLSDREELVNRAFLYNPSGELAVTQDKVNLLPMEEEWNIKRGRSFSVCATPLGNLGFPVCMDATYYETFRTLELSGADIVLLPIANLEAYNFWLALRGIWPRVQESPVYGIKGALVGTVAGFSFTGKAGIFAPLELTAGRDGVLAEAQSHDQEAMAVADLDLEALHDLRADHPWRDINLPLYRRYFPEIYGSPGG